MPVSADGTVTLVVEKDFWGVLFPFDHTLYALHGNRVNGDQYLLPVLESGDRTGCARRLHGGEGTSKILEVVMLQEWEPLPWKPW